MPTLSRRTRVRPALGGAAAAAAIALVVAACGGSSRSVTTVIKQPSSSEPASFSSSGAGMSINQIYRSASPGVVDIKVVSKTASSGNSLFGGGGGTQTGEGAGVVYDSKGDILTDEHVVANAVKVVVNFQDGKQAPAKVLGTDKSTDVGVIRVNVPSSELHPIKFADSSAAKVGDPVVAIGSPFSLPETVTSGIVSQTGRSIPAPNGFTISGAIQTDAAINPGNSGGPLLNADGQVLGLNDQIDTNSTNAATGQGQNSGIGFATPSNVDVQVAGEIIAGKPVKHAYVGVSLDSSSGQAKIAQPSPGCATPVTPGGPAARAGLRPGDVITAIDGKAVTSTSGFISTLGNYTPGQTVTLTVKRNGQTKQLKVTLGNRPPGNASCGG